MGFPVPDEAVLRSDLGPPVGDLFTTLGLPPELLERAVAAYRRFYRDEGMQQASVYPGVVEVLDALAGAGTVLGTATAKLTTVAGPFLACYGLDRHLSVVNGTDDTHHTKTETLRRTLELLGRPNPARVLMVGDRHSDITAGLNCGVRTVGVLWGYGTEDELAAAGAHHLVAEPHELMPLLG